MGGPDKRGSSVYTIVYSRKLPDVMYTTTTQNGRITNIGSLYVIFLTTFVNAKCSWT